MTAVWGNVRNGAKMASSATHTVSAPYFASSLPRPLDFVTNDDGFEFHFQRIGQFAALGQQFETHVGDLVAFEFDIYKYIVHLLRAD